MICFLLLYFNYHFDSQMRCENYPPRNTLLTQPTSPFPSKKASSGDELGRFSFGSGRRLMTENDPLYSYTEKKRLNRQTNIGNRKGIRQYERRQFLGPAPPLQFIKYLDSTENVFYQNRTNAKIMKIIADAKPLLITSFLFLLLTYYLLSFVKGYTGVCPLNAECGVYVHCNPGYQLSQNYLCEISEETKFQRSAICALVIDNLKLKYGANECDNMDEIPTKQLSEIYEEFEVQSIALKEEINNWLKDPNNEKENKFKYNNRKLIPLQKRYPFLCKVSLMLNSRSFQTFLLLSTLLAVIGLIIIERVLLKTKGKRIYNDLKWRVEIEKDIVIDIKELTHKYGTVNARLWTEVDLARSKEKKIVYYETENLHWKLL